MKTVDYSYHACQWVRHRPLRETGAARHSDSRGAGSHHTSPRYSTTIPRLWPDQVCRQIFRETESNGRYCSPTRRKEDIWRGVAH
jgi:hypothetical protein